MLGAFRLAGHCEAFLSGAAADLPSDVVQRAFRQLEPLYRHEVARRTNCPDPDVLIAILLGNDAADQQVRLHVQGCGRCQQELAKLRSLQRLATDSEMFLSGTDEEFPSVVASRIFEGASAVYKEQISKETGCPSRQQLLSVLAGGEGGAEIRAHINQCGQCGAAISKLCAVFRFAGASESFASDFSEEVPSEIAERIFLSANRPYQQQIVAAATRLAKTADMAVAPTEAAMDEPAVTLASSHRSAMARRLQRVRPYASAACLLVALGVAVFSGVNSKAEERIRQLAARRDPVNESNLVDARETGKPADVVEKRVGDDLLRALGEAVQIAADFLSEIQSVDNSELPKEKKDTLPNGNRHYASNDFDGALQVVRNESSLFSAEAKDVFRNWMAVREQIVALEKIAIDKIIVKVDSNPELVGNGSQKKPLAELVHLSKRDAQHVESKESLREPLRRPSSGTGRSG